MHRKIAALICFVLLAPVAANSYEFLGYKWLDDNIPVNYFVNEDWIPSSLNKSAVTNAIRNAFSTWENVSTTKISFIYRGKTETYALILDGANVVDWYPLGSYTLGITYMWYYQDILYEADIAFNMNMPWFFSGTSSYQFDLQTVALHEIGHFIGLDHVAGINDVMYASLSPGEIKRELSADNINAVSALYPGTKASLIPANLIVNRNAPNPFKPVSPEDFTLLTFTLNQDAHLRIDIFNLAGEHVKILADEHFQAGSYMGANGIRWHGDNGTPGHRGSNCASGVYIYQFKTSLGDYVMGKIMLIR